MVDLEKQGDAQEKTRLLPKAEDKEVLRTPLESAREWIMQNIEKLTHAFQKEIKN